MKRTLILFIALLTLFAALSTRAQVPGVIRYQGVLESNGNNYNGTGQFKFALVNDGVPSLVTFWSNDATPSGEPANYVEVELDKGVFAVDLGDASIPNMVPIPLTVFTNPAVHLRIWFSDGNGNDGFSQLTPDQPITAVGYAMMAANVPDGAITENKIANGAVTGEKIAPNTITSSDIADVLTLQKLNLGGLNWDGSLNLFAQPSGGGGGIINPSGALRGVLEADQFGSQFDLFLSDGSTGAVVSARSPGGALRLWDSLGSMTAFLGAGNGGGDLNLFQKNGDPGIKLNGDKATYSNQGTAGGEISVHTAGGQIGLLLDGSHSDAGRIEVRQASNTLPFVDIFGRGLNNGGEVRVSDASARTRITLLGSEGMIRLFGPTLSPTMEMRGIDGDLVALTRVGVAANINASVLQASLGRDGNGGLVRTRDENDLTTTLIGAGTQGGFMRLYQGNAQEGVTLDGDNGSGGAIAVRDADGTRTIHLMGGQDGNSGSRLEMTQANGALTVILDGEVGNGGGGYLQLRKGDGTATITLDSDSAGEGRITTQVLQITGGSDLSEKFDIRPVSEGVEAGMVVCIDPQNPAKLVVSQQPYDRTVAGVISGAGGVKPGMLMSQAGSTADGQHPVALTGRVYCRVDAAYGAIRPGDLITTSETPGHGMKVTDHTRANGAILGKAMSGLDDGRGLVLVLVSLQ